MVKLEPPKVVLYGTRLDSYYKFLANIIIELDSEIDEDDFIVYISKHSDVSTTRYDRRFILSEDSSRRDMLLINFPISSSLLQQP